jgi:hypothetical protein
MSIESIVLAVVILAVGVPSVIALFGVSRAFTESKDATLKMETALREATQGLVRAASDSAARNEAILKELSSAVVQAAQKSTQASDSVAESLRRMEQRVTESISTRDTQAKEDRQIAQSIAADNRQAVRQSADTLKERVDELKDRVAGVALAIKTEASESRKWDAEKAAERMEKEFERYSSVIGSLIEKLENSGKQIAERVDQGSRLVHKATEAKGDELAAQLRALAGLQPEVRAIASQLEQNRAALDALRKTISADVSPLTGE